MKIRTKKMEYAAVMALPKPAHKTPRRFIGPLRGLVAALALPDLLATRFRYSEVNMEAAGDGPWLVLMNHSSFIDLEIAAFLLRKRPYNIVTTSDAFVAWRPLLGLIGCIPTQKFVTDVQLIGDMIAVKKRGDSILMYPEASYSFDGTATPLPRKLGVLLKKLDLPVVYIQTEGAFARDPLYNMLQRRKVRVSATMSCLLTREQIKKFSVQQLDEVLDAAYSFDNFAWQRQNRIKIDEPFRADGLERILYKCPHCLKEGQTAGKGVSLTCHACGKSWTLDEYGSLKADAGVTEFSHIPEWYKWERQRVRRDLQDGDYSLEVPVDIGIIRDGKALYMVGEGLLRHDLNGFDLTGCGGQLHYTQSPKASYGLYADYFWYEKGDVICIGDKDALYYCFPKTPTPVAKARLAAEELYKMVKAKKAAE